MEKKERSRTRVIQMDNLRSLLGIKRTNRVTNAQKKMYVSDERGELKD